jgi:hypothetical protein
MQAGVYASRRICKQAYMQAGVYASRRICKQALIIMPDYETTAGPVYGK